MFWEYFPIEIHMPAPVKRALQYIFGVGININEAFFIRFLFKLTSSGFFIMADSGTSLTSSSSKDVMQQETFEQSVDQDTPAQGVYSYMCNLFIWSIYRTFTLWPCFCCNIDDSSSLYCFFYVVTLLILMFWEYFPIEIHMSTFVKQARWYIC